MFRLFGFGFGVAKNQVQKTIQRAWTKTHSRNIGTSILINDLPNNPTAVRVISDNDTFLENSALQEMKRILAKDNDIYSSYSRTGGLTVENITNINDLIRAQKIAETNVTTLSAKLNNKQQQEVTVTSLNPELLGFLKNSLHHRGIESQMVPGVSPTLVATEAKVGSDLVADITKDTAFYRRRML